MSIRKWIPIKSIQLKETHFRTYFANVIQSYNSKV